MNFNFNAIYELHHDEGADFSPAIFNALSGEVFPTRSFFMSAGDESMGFQYISFQYMYHDYRFPVHQQGQQWHAVDYKKSALFRIINAMRLRDVFTEEAVGSAVKMSLS